MDAILGTTQKVVTVDGPVDLKIPAGGCLGAGACIHVGGFL